MLKTTMLGLACCFSVAVSASQHNDKLKQEILQLDQVVFGQGYNQCDVDALAAVTSDSFEFYHDEHGITNSKSDFLNGIKNGLCQLDYKPRRELIDGSTEVYPLKKQGVIYGAIQRGDHRFYAKYPNKPEVMTSIAKFTTLWMLEGGKWRMTRVLSFDHRKP